MTQQRYPSREHGLRRVGLITATLAAAGLVGTGAVAVLAHADTTATKTTSTTTNNTSTNTNSNTNSNSNTDSGVTDGTGSAPQAQSAGS